MKNSIYFFGALSLFVLSSFMSAEALDNKLAIADSSEEMVEAARCYDFIYPISYFMPDESEISGDNANEIAQQIKEWYEQNPGEENKPQLGYPVTVVVDGNEQVLDSEEDLNAVKQACREATVIPDEARKCIEYVNPLVYVLPDGTEVEGDDLSVIKGTIRDWYDLNPLVDARPVLQFPVEIIIFGQGVIVEDEDTLNRYKKKCKKRYIRNTSEN